VPGKDKLEAIIHDPRAKNKTEAFGAVARASFKLVEPTQGWGGARWCNEQRPLNRGKQPLPYS
jgi:hypothetical protein